MTGEWARWRRRLAELEWLAGDGALDTVTPLTVGPAVDRATVELVVREVGELVLAHHDDMPLTPGDLDGATQRLAGSFTELVDRWSELCFPEPSVLLDHHLARGVGEIDLRCLASRRRLQLFGELTSGRWESGAR